jgi:hypothetical protein
MNDLGIGIKGGEMTSEGAPNGSKL